MKNLTLCISLLFSTIVLSSDYTPVIDLNNVDDLKAEILLIAQDNLGKPDQDFRIQNTLVPYVNKLLKVAPQKPIKERITALVGRWQQVWGPYEYRKYDRTVDPTTDPSLIFQVIFKGGYYYNVANTIDEKTGLSDGTTLLRGKFKIGAGNDLNVRFTNLKKINGFPPAGLSYTDLAALSENDELEGERTVLPGFIVRLFFGGGTLKEVYTDDTMRITYGTSRQADAPFLYVLKRVQ